MVSANGTRVLQRAGRRSGAATAFGTVSDRLVLRRWEDDAELMSVPMGSAPQKRWGYLNYSLYRPDLIALLADHLSGVEVRFGVKVVDIEQRSDRAVAVLADGARVEGRCADRCRRDPLGRPDGDGRSTPETATAGTWRIGSYSPATTCRRCRSRRPTGSGPTVTWSATSSANPSDSSTLFSSRQRSGWAEESWTAPGSVDTLREAFANWSPEVQHILDRVRGEVFRWALHDREPLDGWQHGRVTLLGDAAHPVVPFMAQGACMAIEDASVLARCLDAMPDDPERALQRYEQVRKPRTDAIQNGSWDNATTFHLPDGPEQVERDAFYRALAHPDVDPLASLDWMQGYDVLAEPI